MKFMVKNVIIPIILNYDTEQIYSIDIAYRYRYIYIYIYIYIHVHSFCQSFFVRARS